VPSHQRWMNNGKFDGGQLTNSEKALRDFIRLLNFSVSSSALMGDFQEIQTVNRQSTQGFDAGIYAFTRWSDTQKKLWSLIFRGRKLVFSNLRFLRML
jgi:hypothetical protein